MTRRRAREKVKTRKKDSRVALGKVRRKWKRKPHCLSSAKIVFCFIVNFICFLLYLTM